MVRDLKFVSLFNQILWLALFLGASVVFAEGENMGPYNSLQIIADTEKLVDDNKPDRMFDTIAKDIQFAFDRAYVEPTPLNKTMVLTFRTREKKQIPPEAKKKNEAPPHEGPLDLTIKIFKDGEGPDLVFTKYEQPEDTSSLLNKPFYDRLRSLCLEVVSHREMLVSQNSFKKAVDEFLAHVEKVMKTLSKDDPKYRSLDHFKTKFNLRASANQYPTNAGDQFKNYLDALAAYKVFVDKFQFPEFESKFDKK